MFGKIFGGAKTQIERVTKMDLLQAIAAAGVLVAGSSGGIDAGEADQLKVSIATNQALAAFNQSDVNRIVGDYITQFQNSPRMGKIKLRKEIEDCAKNPAEAEQVFAVACDVADQGGIDAAEKAVLIEIAGWLKVNPSDFGL